MQYTLTDEYELKNSEKNKLSTSDTEFHDWYRFVLSYPPHLVRKYFKEFNLTSDDVVLDPFCGTGTTLVEAKLNNIPSIGIEANHFAYFASSIKTDWSIDPGFLYACAIKIKEHTLAELCEQGIADSIILYDEPLKLRKLPSAQEKDERVFK